MGVVADRLTRCASAVPTGHQTGWRPHRHRRRRLGRPCPDACRRLCAGRMCPAPHRRPLPTRRHRRPPRIRPHPRPARPTRGHRRPPRIRPRPRPARPTRRHRRLHPIHHRCRRAQGRRSNAAEPRDCPDGGLPTTTAPWANAADALCRGLSRRSRRTRSGCPTGRRCRTGACRESRRPTALRPPRLRAA